MRKSDDTKHTVHMARDDDLVVNVNDKLVSEAKIDWRRWEDREDWKNALAKLQNIYGQTVHTAHGSTHGSTFVDIADIRRRERDNLLECKQLIYTALIASECDRHNLRRVPILHRSNGR